MHLERGLHGRARLWWRLCGFRRGGLQRSLEAVGVHPRVLRPAAPGRERLQLVREDEPVLAAGGVSAVADAAAGAQGAGLQRGPEGVHDVPGVLQGLLVGGVGVCGLRQGGVPEGVCHAGVDCVALPQLASLLGAEQTVQSLAQILVQDCSSLQFLFFSFSAEAVEFMKRVHSYKTVAKFCIHHVEC